MSFAKCVQVLFLVLLCLSTFCCANRVLIDHTYVEQPNSERTHRVAMTGGQGGGGGGGGGGYGGSGSGSGLGDPNCGDGQPWYPPPVGGGGGGCGCGGCSCGGGGSPPGGGSCAPVPQPITCPVGCQPAFGEPNMVYWAYKWPTHMSHHGHSFESNKHMYGAEAQTIIDADDQGREPNKKARPNEKEKQDSEPMSPNEEEKNNGGPKPNEKVKQNVEVWPNEKEKQDSEPISVYPFGKGD